MATEVKIPVPDQTTEEVRIVKWHKAVGDAVKQGEVVLEVETDKSVIEVEAVGSGVLLAQGAAEDAMVPVGEVVGIVGPAGAEVSLGAAKPEGAAKAEASVAGAAPGSGASAAGQEAVSGGPAAGPAGAGDGRIKASPVARQLAAKLGVDLRLVAGSGPKGRIVKADVERFAQSGAGTPGGSVSGAGAAPGVEAVVRATIVNGRLLASPNAKRLARELGVDLRLVAGSGPGGRIVGADVQQAAKAGTAAVGEGPATVSAAGVAATAAAIPTGAAPGQPQPGTEMATSKMRRAIAVNLQSSSRDTPHFNATMSVNMARALAFRKQINEGVEKGQRVSVNDLVVKACAVALTQYPAVNSRFCGETIKYLGQINIGVATAVPDGLVVPVVTEADKRSWRELAVETKRLAGSARQGKILGAGKGTFTVSNLGMYGVEQFTGIINPPEAAILTVGAVQEQVVAVKGMIGIQPMMKVTLCSDHRVVDGALAAQFLQAVKLYLEEQIG